MRCRNVWVFRWKGHFQHYSCVLLHFITWHFIKYNRMLLSRISNKCVFLSSLLLLVCSDWNWKVSEWMRKFIDERIHFYHLKIPNCICVRSTICFQWKWPNISKRKCWRWFSPNRINENHLKMSSGSNCEKIITNWEQNVCRSKLTAEKKKKSDEIDANMSTTNAYRFVCLFVCLTQCN